MGRTLRYLGLCILAVTACLLLADSFRWLPPEVADAWVRSGAWAGVALLGAGIVLGLLSPVQRELRRGRCVRCGAQTERGQTYCRDHLQATVNEYRDQARDGLVRRPGGRG